MYPEHFQSLGATLPATPAMVLSYRTAWNDYVMSTSCALYVQAWALKQVAAGKPVPNRVDASFTCATTGASSTGQQLTAWASKVTGPLVDLSQYAMQPPSAQLLQDEAQLAKNEADLIQQEWNPYNGWSDSQIVLEAGAILSSYQKTVLEVGQTDRPSLSRFAPAIATVLPSGADPSLQAQLIANIEGAQILASGTLEIIETGAGGAVTGLYNSSQWAAQQVGKVTSAVTSPWFWLSGAAIAVGFATYYVVKHADDVSALVGRHAKPAANESRHYVRMMQNQRGRVEHAAASGARRRWRDFSHYSILGSVSLGVYYVVDKSYETGAGWRVLAYDGYDKHDVLRARKVGGMYRTRAEAKTQARLDAARRGSDLA